MGGPSLFPTSHIHTRLNFLFLGFEFYAPGHSLEPGLASRLGPCSPIVQDPTCHSGLVSRGDGSCVGAGDGKGPEVWGLFWGLLVKGIPEWVRETWGEGS